MSRSNATVAKLSATRLKTAAYGSGEVMTEGHEQAEHLVPMSALDAGTRGRIVRVIRDLTGRADRLAALGVTPGASIHVVQTFPGIVFECDQTELAIERAVARSILISVEA